MPLPGVNEPGPPVAEHGDVAAQRPMAVESNIRDRVFMAVAFNVKLIFPPIRLNVYDGAIWRFCGILRNCR